MPAVRAKSTKKVRKSVVKPHYLFWVIAILAVIGTVLTLLVVNKLARESVTGSSLATETTPIGDRVRISIGGLSNVVIPRVTRTPQVPRPKPTLKLGKCGDQCQGYRGQQDCLNGLVCADSSVPLLKTCQKPGGGCSCGDDCNPNSRNNSCGRGLRCVGTGNRVHQCLAVLSCTRDGRVISAQNASRQEPLYLSCMDFNRGVRQMQGGNCAQYCGSGLDICKVL
jgi:hypothetical protein